MLQVPTIDIEISIALQVQENLELGNCLSELASFIISSCHNKNDYTNFTGNSLGPYKRYNKSHKYIEHKLGHQLTLSLFYVDFAYLTDNLEAKYLKNSLFKLISDFYKLQPNLGGRGIPNESQLVHFKNLLQIQISVNQQILTL